MPLWKWYEIAAWLEAKTVDEEKTIAHRLNKAALDHVVFAPLGFFLQRTFIECPEKVP